MSNEVKRREQLLFTKQH